MSICSPCLRQSYFSWPSWSARPWPISGTWQDRISSRRCGSLGNGSRGAKAGPTLVLVIVIVNPLSLHSFGACFCFQFGKAQPRRAAPVGYHSPNAAPDPWAAIPANTNRRLARRMLAPPPQTKQHFALSDVGQPAAAHAPSIQQAAGHRQSTHRTAASDDQPGGDAVAATTTTSGGGGRGFNLTPADIARHLAAQEPRVRDGLALPQYQRFHSPKNARTGVELTGRTQVSYIRERRVPATAAPVDAGAKKKAWTGHHW